MKKKFISASLVAVLLFAGGYLYYTYFTPGHSGHDKAAIQIYTCPMHPQIVKDHPGDCPICGMKLVPMKNEEKQSDIKKKIIRYRSSMHPSEVSDKPGKDSMGMEMVPFEVADDSGPALRGLAPVRIHEQQRRTLGITFETVKLRNIFREIRASARIVADETRQHRVTTKTEGWVERLYVNQTGQFIRRGAPLLAIYSPELLSAQQEYVSAIKAREKFTHSSDDFTLKNMGEIEESARERLKLLDMSDQQIARIQKTGVFERTVIIHSPSTGYVTEKMVLQGQRIMMNDALMVIVDLSKVWGEIDVYESDIPYVKKGMPVEVTLSYWPEKKFRGVVSFLNPFLDPNTRTLKARLEIPNPGLILKPEMFGDARFSLNIGKKIAVPESAVMRSGLRDYVFVEGKEELIVPYEITLGMRSSSGHYEVLGGLKPGDRVVISANFLIDSESSLKAAFKTASEGDAPKKD